MPKIAQMQSGDGSVKIDADVSQIHAVRSVLRACRRLSVSEHRHWFPPRIVFTVRGPEDAIGRMLRNLDAVLADVWNDRKW